MGNNEAAVELLEGGKLVVAVSIFLWFQHPLVFTTFKRVDGLCELFRRG